MKTIFLTLLMTASLMFGQTKGQCTYDYPTVTGGHFVYATPASPNPLLCNFIPDATQAAFDAAYWAAQPLPVQALKGAPSFDLAISLAKQGYLIDAPIMASGQDPYVMMSLRVMEGYSWIPSFLQPNIAAGPGIVYNGLPLYNPNPPFPAGSIAVSVDVTHYPTVTPTPAPVPQVLPVIGSFAYLNAQGQGVYYGGLGDSFALYPNGSVYVNTVAPQGTFVKTVVQGLMGQSAYWTLQSGNNMKKAPPAVKK